MIRPFEEGNGVAITFDEKTFDGDQTTVEFKVILNFLFLIGNALFVLVIKLYQCV